MKRYKEIREEMNQAIRQVAMQSKQILSTAELRVIRKKLFQIYRKRMKGQQ
jgi:hypothetical protein